MNGEDISNFKCQRVHQHKIEKKNKKSKLEAIISSRFDYLYIDNDFVLMP